MRSMRCPCGSEVFNATVAGLIILGVAAGPLAAVDVHDTRLLSQPALSANHLAFVYAEDLWIADRNDGAPMRARRLTSHQGSEAEPRFSPDGKTVAFSAEYDGNLDVYVVAVEGGVPRRLTWHPGDDHVVDFTPDGAAVLFRSRRASHTRRHSQLYTVPLAGDFPTRLAVPRAFRAAYSPDGSQLAYVPSREAFHQWKNYRGGTVSRIWVQNMADHSVVEIPQPEGRSNDTDPMWVGGKIYFRSDRNGEFNLFSYDPVSKSVTQHTEYEDFPIVKASASIDRDSESEIVYEQAGYLHVFDPQTATHRKLMVGVSADLIETRPRYARGGDFVREFDLSPTGSRAVLSFRGEIVTVPAEKGDPRNLTRTPGVHEHGAVWSPDGRKVAYFSDSSGEYELHVADRAERGEVRSYPLGGAGFYEDAKWSPDGAKLSFADNSRSIFWIDLESGAVTKVSSDVIYGPVRLLHHAWSPDSRWLTYTRNTETYFQQVYLYNLESDRSTPVTDGLSDVDEPVFDKSGKYLYFLASTDAGPVRAWFAQSSNDMELSRSLYLAVLQKGVPSPLAAESDEEELEAEDAAAGSTEEESDAPPRVEVDFEGLNQRILTVPVGTASMRRLVTGEAGQIYFLKIDEHVEGREAGSGRLQRYALDERKEETLLGGVADYTVSADGKKVLAVAGDRWVLGKAQGSLDSDAGQLAVDSIAIPIDPRAEWRQIFDEAWRINRDYFYDPGMHGADWPAMRQKYAQFLPHLTTRGDLNRVIRWMCSELGVGHHRNGGGDHLAEAETVPGGLLGADYDIDRGRYRFKKVFGGLNWNPQLRAPLTEPGVEVASGEYLLAVEGRQLRPPANLFQMFENTAGKIVELTVGPDPEGEGARTVHVVPIDNEGRLRNRDWVEGNVKRVDEATDGRVAYVHVPNTATGGHTYFKRYFFPQAHKQAVIIDERYNGGGLVADYYIDILRRPLISHWAMRYGKDLKSPLASIQGPKVMLIDEDAGSGGDLLPWMFRKFGLGPLVGKRTWGGLVGILGFPPLMDGGFITAPNLAFWTEEEGFGVENVGVPPDYDVEQWPVEVNAGRDPQLEKAIELALAALEADPPRPPVKPDFPIRVRR